MEHLPLDPDWSTEFPSSQWLFPSSQVKCLEAWEDNMASSVAIVNHLELFHKASLDRLASAQNSS